MTVPDSFIAYREDGSTVRITKVVPRRVVRNLDGLSDYVLGPARLLSNGQPVNMIDEKTFQIVATGEIVHRKL